MKPKLLDIPFPLKGYNETVSHSEQPELTTPNCLNVRAYDPDTRRNRGSQRPGLSKYVATQPSASVQIQMMARIAAANTSAASASSIATRTITNVEVAAGTVKKFTSSGFTLATSGTSALDANAPVIYSAEMFGVLYFADGINKKKWTASTNTVAPWAASAGTFPEGTNTDYPRLIATWRGRLVMSGIITDPHNWFMTKIGDATDFDSSPATPTVCQAVDGNNSDAGKITDDIITCICPYNDDILFFGGDHSIYQMTGDPAEHGQLDRISDVTGMAWGRPFTKDPSGVVYFVSSRAAIYKMVPHQIPVRISSGAIEDKLRDLDMSDTLVTAAWNDDELGVNFWFTSLSGSASTHLFYDLRNEAFWIDSYSDAGMNPTSVLTIDGDDPDDRTVLLGCRDGYIRQLDMAAYDDDGQKIASNVYLGPITFGPTQKIQLRELQFQMSENTDSCLYEVYNGNTAEASATNAVPRITGTLDKGKNSPDRRRINGPYLYVNLKGNCLGDHWSYENCVAIAVPLGQNERRRVTT